MLTLRETIARWILNLQKQANLKRDNLQSAKFCFENLKPETGCECDSADDMPRILIRPDHKICQIVLNLSITGFLIKDVHLVRI